MTAHKWLLIVQPAAQKQFDRLQPAQKRSIFRHLIELLNADDPYSLNFVEMLQDKKFERTRKFRAGDFRVFFNTESGEVVHLKQSYKGRLHLLAVQDRREAY